MKKKSDTNTENRPQIEKYHDYFIFLKDWLKYMKIHESNFSLRNLSRKANVAVGYLPMVLSGQRRLSESAFEKLIPHLNLTKREQKILNLLRTIGESENPEIRSEALTDLQKMKEYQLNNSSEIEVFKYLSRWENVAIREMLNLPDFQLSPAWIQERLNAKIGLTEIQNIIDFLKNHGFISLSPDGKTATAKKSLQCEDGVFRISLSDFHRQMLDKIEDSIENTPREQRSIMGHTRTLSSKEFAALKLKIADFINDLDTAKNTTQDLDSEVYHITLAAVPLTSTTRRGR